MGLGQEIGLENGVRKLSQGIGLWNKVMGLGYGIGLGDWVWGWLGDWVKGSGQGWDKVRIAFLSQHHKEQAHNAYNRD